MWQETQHTAQNNMQNAQHKDTRRKNKSSCCVCFCSCCVIGVFCVWDDLADVRLISYVRCCKIYSSNRTTVYVTFALGDKQACDVRPGKDGRADGQMDGWIVGYHCATCVIGSTFGHVCMTARIIHRAACYVVM